MDEAAFETDEERALWSTFLSLRGKIHPGNLSSLTSFRFVLLFFYLFTEDIASGLSAQFIWVARARTWNVDFKYNKDSVHLNLYIIICKLKHGILVFEKSCVNMAGKYFFNL